LADRAERVSAPPLQVCRAAGSVGWPLPPCVAETNILVILIVKVGFSLLLFFQILGFVLFTFWLLLIARVVIEWIRSFSRDWRPTGFTVVILELIMSITDPPVKLLRRLIPQITIGAVRLDLSILVLLLVAFIGMQLAFSAAA
jgi:YggT family protein